MKNTTEKIARIPDAELDIMLILWEKTDENGDYAPSRILDVYNGMKEVRPCTRSAIHSLLERLRERGFVRIDLVDAPSPYKLITPIVSESDYREAESENFIRKLCRGNRKTLIATLIKTGKITDDDIGEISEMLGERGKEQK